MPFFHTYRNPAGPLHPPRGPQEGVQRITGRRIQARGLLNVVSAEETQPKVPACIPIPPPRLTSTFGVGGGIWGTGPVVARFFLRTSSQWCLFPRACSSKPTKVADEPPTVLGLKLAKVLIFLVFQGILVPAHFLYTASHPRPCEDSTNFQTARFGVC